MTALAMSPVRVPAPLKAVGARARVALANIRYLPLRRRHNAPDAANALWAELLAYQAESRAFDAYCEEAATDAERAARQAEYDAFDEPNAMPRYFGIVEKIEALPPSLNAAAARLMREVLSEVSAADSLTGPNLDHITFTLRALLPFLSGVIAESARAWIAAADEGGTMGDTPIWH